MTEVLSATGVLVSTSPRRGRGPAHLLLDSGLELGTFDPEMFKLATTAKGAPVTVTYTVKEGKEGKSYQTLASMTIDGEVPGGPEPAPGDAGEGEAIPSPSREPETALVRRSAPVAVRPLTEMEVLDMQYQLAAKRHELVLTMLRDRLKENTHWVDGTMFGGKKPVLLQPGAHAIFQALAYSCEPTIISGPLVAPKDPREEYTIVVRAEVKTLDGRFVGAQMGSCSSHIWSNRAGSFVARAVDADKTHNSTLKMATKRATVAACRQTTPASELFQEDLDEGGYADHGGTQATKRKAGGFIR